MTWFGRDEADKDGHQKKKRQSTMNEEIKTIKREEPTTRFGATWNSFTHYIDNNRRQIFWVTLYTLVVCGIFIERAYCTLTLQCVLDF